MQGNELCAQDICNAHKIISHVHEIISRARNNMSWAQRNKYGA